MPIDNNIIYEIDKQVINKAKYAVAGAFLLGGIGVGLWFVHIPIVTQRLNLTAGIMGLVFLTSAFGAAVAQLLMGVIISRIGSQKALIYSLPLLLISFVLPILAWNTLALFIAAWLFGAASGLYNISVNMQASEVETARDKPTMSFFHGFFSIGGIIAAASGGTIIFFKMGEGSGAVIVSIFMLIICFIMSKYYFKNETKLEPNSKKTGFKLPNLKLLGICALAFSCLMIEGSANDWSALFLVTIKNTTEAVAAMGYAAFSIAMAIIRFAGASIIEKTSEKNVVVWGGLLVATGISIVIFSPNTLFSASGFFVVGVGAANIMPILLGNASRLTDFSPSISVAITATAGQMGFILGPTIIGFVSQFFGLTFGIGLVGAVGLMVALGGMFRRWTV